MRKRIAKDTLKLQRDYKLQLVGISEVEENRKSMRRQPNRTKTLERSGMLDGLFGSLMSCTFAGECGQVI